MGDFGMGRGSILSGIVLVGFWSVWLCASFSLNGNQDFEDSLMVISRICDAVGLS